MAKKKKPKFKCTSEAQKKAIRRSYAIKSSKCKGNNGLFKLHFRRFKKQEGKKGEEVRHPKLIIGEYGNYYDFMGLTESTKRGHHKNIELFHNPKKGDKRVVYLRDEKRRDIKENFYPYPEANYSLSKIDEQRILNHLAKKEKK